MRFDICSTGQILHSSAKKSRALQLQFPLFESVSSQLVSQHLFLNFDSIRKYRFTRVKFRRGEKTIASNNAENVFFPPIVNFGRFHSWNRLDLLLSCSLFFLFFLFWIEFTQVELSSRSMREKEIERIRFISPYWKSAVAHLKLGNRRRKGGRGSFLKRIKDTTLRAIFNRIFKSPFFLEI